MDSQLKLGLTLCHATPFRLRVRVPGLRERPAEARALEVRPLRDRRLKSVSVRPSTGSVVLHFSGEKIPSDEVLSMLAAAASDTDNASDRIPAPVAGTEWKAAGANRSGVLRVAALTGLTAYHLIRLIVFRTPLGAKWGILLVLFGGYALFQRAVLDLFGGRIFSAHVFLSAATLLASAAAEAAAGLLSPVMSGASHILHTVVIFANSSRLLAYR